MGRSSLRWITLFILPLMATIPYMAAEKIRPGHGVVEGNIRSQGQPIRDAEISVIGAPYLLNNSFTVPIITPKVVGTVGVKAPPSELNVYSRRKSDRRGHYSTTLPKGRFAIYAELPKKEDPQRSTKLLRLVTIVEGQTISQDFDFSTKWQEAEQSREEFVKSLNQVISAAKEELPMRSILFTPLNSDDTSFWIPTVLLPGADSCHIFTFNSMVVKGQNVALPIYACDTQYATPAAAEAAYVSFVKFVTEITGWKAASSDKPNQTVFHPSDLPAGDEVRIGLSKVGVLISYWTADRAHENAQKSEPPTPITPSPALDDSPRAVAAAIAQIMAAGREKFEPIKGQQIQFKIDPGEIKHWEVAVVVPGFRCLVHESKITSSVACASLQSQADEGRHLSLARALTDQLRGQGYSCESTRATPLRAVETEPVAIQQFSFRRNYNDSQVGQILERYTNGGIRGEPSGSFSISFVVSPPLVYVRQTDGHVFVWKGMGFGPSVSTSK